MIFINDFLDFPVLLRTFFVFTNQPPFLYIKGRLSHRDQLKTQRTLNRIHGGKLLQGFSHDAFLSLHDNLLEHNTALVAYYKEEMIESQAKKYGILVILRVKRSFLSKE